MIFEGLSKHYEIIVRPNKGLISFTYGTRSASNEERYEGLMRSTLVGSVPCMKQMIICSSLRKENI